MLKILYFILASALIGGAIYLMAASKIDGNDIATVIFGFVDAVFFAAYFYLNKLKKQ